MVQQTYNKDLVRHDNLIESQEHTCNDADTLMSREGEKESEEDESQMNSLVSNNNCMWQHKTFETCRNR
jgi:hypothetical protein